MIAAAVFDFDGTLFDVADAICLSFNGALVETGRPPSPEARIRSWIGRPLLEMFAEEDPGADAARIDRRIGIYRRIFLPVCVDHARPLPGAAECLDRLRAAGVRLAIATNRKTDGADVILRGHGLRDRFETIVGIEDVRRTKPDPEPVRVALQRLGVSPDRAAMIGDTPEDMAAAVGAGAWPLGVATGAHTAAALTAAGAARVMDSLAELPAIIAGSGAPPGIPLPARSA